MLIRDFLKYRTFLKNCGWAKSAVIGFIANSFDILGIGSYAPKNALLKFTKQPENRLIPGKINVANTLPSIIQAIIFIKIVKVDPLPLVLMPAASTAGAVIVVEII